MSDTIPDILTTAQKSHQAGDLAGAEQAYRQALEADPRQVEALTGLAGIAYQLGRFDEAAAWLRQAAARDEANARVYTSLGAVYRAAGRLEEAEACHRRALRLQPDLAEASNNLGSVLWLQGRRDEALARFQQAALARPDYADAYQNLGLALLEVGRAAEAVEPLRLALRLRPPQPGTDSPVARGLARAESEAPVPEPPAARGEEAKPAAAPAKPEGGEAGPGRDEAQLREALRLDADDAEAHFALGLLLGKQGRLEEAATALFHATRLRPDHAAAYLKLGTALREIGQAGRAVGYLRFALRLRPGQAEAYHRLGLALADLGRLEEAAAAYREALRLRPDFPPTLTHLGNLLEELGPADEGRRLLDRALALAPDDVQVRTHYGMWLVNQGRVAEAQEHFLRAVALQPDFAPAYFFLARDGNHRFAEADVRKLEEMLARENLRLRHRIHLHFALARLRDRERAFAEAFRHCEQGNARKQELLTLQGNAFRTDEHARYIDRLRATFDADYLRRVQGFGSPDPLPVFIVGMPRSGTSLVEQILASHPAVHGAGEIRNLRLLIEQLPAELGTPVEYPECLGALTADKARSLAGEYLAGLRRLGGEALRVTDKVPMNFHHLGLIAALLPGARIIHCRRDARDVCWSCFFQNFREVHFSCDLKTLGAYHRQYERLMAHWKEVLPQPVLEVRYEDLVHDLEGISREMVAFCGLPWDEACLSFYQTRRPVLTASNLQVRQPVYTKSIGYWKNYEAFLGPLLEALGQ